MARRVVSLLLLLTVLGAPALHAPEPVRDLADVNRVRAPLVLSFVGDIMHHRRNAEMPDYDRLYDSVRKLLQIDDLSFANLEFPIDPSLAPSGYPIFNGSVAYVEAAVRAGFDLFALANNHSYDLARPGVVATRSVIDDLASRTGIKANGLRDAVGAPLSVTRIAHRGWSIGFISITTFSNVGGAAPSINLVNYFDPVVRSDFLRSVRRWASEYDLLVVGVHAGAEYSSRPVAHKARFLREISDAGAHIVWGHHSHVLQPWEHRNSGVIIHSAGNFVSAQRRHQSPDLPLGRWAPTGDTTIYQVRVAFSEDRAQARVVGTPVFSMYDSPSHGLVLRSFDELFAEPMPLTWRAFYLARYPAVRRLVVAGE